MALESMQYILKVSERYAKFFQKKIHSRNDKTSALQEESTNRIVDEDAKFMKQMKYFKGNLRSYQVEGVTWLMMLFENSMNGILADEMGLGKTVQIIALICKLVQQNLRGPFLVLAPLSTIPNWESEFKRFAPSLPVIVFHGNAEKRRLLKQTINKNYYVDDKKCHPIILTNYNSVLIETAFLKSISWKYIIVDEGHRLKNFNSTLARELSKFNTMCKLLLTGTPIQNDMTELWSLLHFIMPQIFTNIKVFSSLLTLVNMQDQDKLVEDEEKDNVISTIHKVIAPFMLRRLKCDVLLDLVPKKLVLVYCPFMERQKTLYAYVLQQQQQKNIAPVEVAVDVDTPRKKRKCSLYERNYKAAEEDDEFDSNEVDSEEVIYTEVKFKERMTLQNTVMMFKKIANHPHLVQFPLKRGTKKELRIDEDIIKESGKMRVLNAMLKKLKAGAHKVLLFSTMVMMLDVIEELMIMENYNYKRLDGSTHLVDRETSIREFNTDPNMFVFLISTRAGGLGLNLTSADTVIFYDRDWNPQADIQAQDRCHRIGQTKPVMIFTLVTKNSIDEKIIDCGAIKRKLEKIVIKDGKFKSLSKIGNDNEVLDLEELARLLAKDDGSIVIHSNGINYTDAELDQLLDRSDLYDQINQNKENVLSL